MKKYILWGLGGLVLVIVIFINYQNSKANRIGKIESTKDGIIRGWVNSSKTPGVVSVQFYVDKDKDAPGTKLFFETQTNSDSKFETSIPAVFGDRKDHVIYTYVTSGEQLIPLDGSPATANFYSPPKASLNVSSPQENAIVTGGTLMISYSVSGDLAGVDNVHWRLDDKAEIRDLGFDGTFELTGLTPGAHTLSGYLASGHHDKILNSDVEINFTSN